MKKTPLPARKSVSPRIQKDGTQVKTVIVLPDFQVPYHDNQSVKVVLDYVSSIWVDEIIILGDFMDIYSLSSHSDGKPGQLEGHKIFEEYEVGNQVLDQIQRAGRNKNKECKFVLLEGNHEFRVERYYDKFPVLRGQMDVDKELRLKEREIKYVLCYSKGDVYQKGNAYFHHGLYGGDNHAKTHVSNFGTNIFYGHLHDVQGYSKVLKGKDKTIVGQSMGCLCEYEQSYIKGNPTRWQQAFGIFYFLPDGYFTYYIPRLFKHRFVDPAGKIWS